MSDTEYLPDQGPRLRCLRDYLGLSVNEAAAMLKVSPRSYQNFESGRMQIPAGVMTDVGNLVHRLDELAGTFSEQEWLHIEDMSNFELRAASIAATARPELRILP